MNLLRQWNLTIHYFLDQIVMNIDDGLFSTSKCIWDLLKKIMKYWIEHNRSLIR